MKLKTIWIASVIASTEAEDAVGQLLATHFAPDPSSYTDVETGRTTVSAYTATPPKNSAVVKKALRLGLKQIKACGLNIGPGTVTIQKLPRRNWAESWKRHFKPIAIGHQLLVKPSWIRRRPKRGQAVIVLDPGLSFGTGQHPTTEFCLREVVRHRIPLASGRSRATAPDPNPGRGKIPIADRSRAFLDIGTGSGILAIAAAKLGYAPIHAFDYDPQSVLVAQENARKNQVASQIKLIRVDLTKLPRHRAKQYDVVCANLLADLLVTERGRILARVKPGGLLVVAGILKREFAEVRTAYEAAGLRLIASRAQKEWCSGTFLKPA